MSIWRPPPIIRPITIGIVRRREELLLMAVRDENDAIKEWRLMHNPAIARQYARVWSST
jgi:hypothetical protein